MNTKILGMLGLTAVLLATLILAGGCGGNKTVIVNQTTTASKTSTASGGKQNDANSGDDVSADLASPYSIDYGEWTGTLNENDLADAYGIKWNPGDTIDIVMTPGNGLDIAFYYVAGGMMQGPINAGLKGEPESIQFTNDISKDIKRFDILINNAAGSGDYKIKITKTPQNDGGKSQDASSDKNEPLQISAGVYEACYLGSNDKTDYYSIQLAAGQKIHITVTPSSTLDVVIDLNGYGYAVTAHLPGFIGAIKGNSGFVNSNFTGEKEETDAEITTAGIYKFGVLKMGETAGNYTLSIQ